MKKYLPEQKHGGRGAAVGRGLLALVSWLLGAGLVWAEQGPAPESPPFVAELSSVVVGTGQEQRVLPTQRAYNHRRGSWAFVIDNDVLTPLQRDQDYTYGFNFTYSGRGAQEARLSLDRPLAALDRLLGVQDLTGRGIYNHSIELGLFGFTPEDIEVVEPNPDDRPYASLLYFSSAREQLDLQRQVSWKTTLTIGVMGLDMVGDLQNRAHDWMAGTDARGWHNQISQGGELTARYAIARQSHLGTLADTTEFKSTWQASVGYLTEASWSLGVRTGKYHTLWSSFNPELTSYGEKSAYTTGSLGISERYFWAGFSLKVRAYNAFLQGQWRDSAVTYRASELNPLLVEAWLGYTLAFAEGYRVSYVLRGHTSEIRQGAGDRSLVWGGLILAKAFD